MPATERIWEHSPAPSGQRPEEKKGRHRGRPDANESEQTTLGETDHDVRGDHQVIEHTHVDQLQRGLQRLRQVLVGTARLRCARRMVVRQDDGRRVQRQARLDDFAGIDRGLRHCAPKLSAPAEL